MFLKEDTLHLIKRAQRLYEQGPAVISSDLQARLKGYLSDASLLNALAKELDKYTDGEYELGYLSKKEYGIMDGDRLFVKVDKSDAKDPKFYMWILNDQYIFGDIDMELAAKLLSAAGVGTNFSERGLIGAIGSFVSGGGEDSGTDEESIAAISGAFAQIAAEKSLDPQIYYDKLGEIFQEKYDKSIATFLEEEFSGYAESVALNAFRQKIEPSVWRGINPWAILGDVALSLTGAGLVSKAFSLGMKGARVASGASKATKAAKAGKSGATLTKAGKALAKITEKSAKFAKLSNKKKQAALAKAGIKKGAKIKWKHGSKGMIPHKVISTKNGVVKLQALSGSKNTFAVGYGNVGQGAELITKTTPAMAKAILDSSGLNVKLAALTAAVAKKGEEHAEGEGLGAKAAGALGYYDSQKADPSAFIENAKNQGASDIASMLLDLKNGSGLFGNTTNQEEGSIALLVTGLIPEMVKKVSAEYKKLDSKMDAYSVLDDELGGDMAIIAKAYWTGCTGEGEQYKAAINNIRTRILKNGSTSGPYQGSSSSSSKTEESEPEQEESESSSSSTLSTVGKKVKTTYTGTKANNIKVLINELENSGVSNPYAQIGLLSVIGKESNYIPKSERMSYSKERLPEVWATFSKTGRRVDKGQGKYAYNRKALQYARNEEKLANYVYGQQPYGMRKNAYGNTERGDGYKYRGRGFNQITFKGSYKKMGQKIGIDLVSDPDQLNKPEVAAKASIRFLLDRLKMKGIDPNSFKSVDSAVSTFAHANAGWGRGRRSVNKAINNAKKYVNRFDVA